MRQNDHPLLNGKHTELSIVLPSIHETDLEPVTLDLISSGVQVSDYSDLVRTFSWQKFFEEQSGGGDSRVLA